MNMSITPLRILKDSIIKMIPAKGFQLLQESFNTHHYQGKKNRCNNEVPLIITHWYNICKCNNDTGKTCNAIYCICLPCLGDVHWHRGSGGDQT